MTALGSSFASGPGIEPQVDRTAARSALNYPHLVAQRLGADLTDVTRGGATTDTILSRWHRVGLRRWPPQIEAVSSDDDLVTITAGGNDLGYLGFVIGAGIAQRLSQHAPTRPLERRIRRTVRPPVSEEQIERAAQGLTRVAQEARRRAPGARILLVGYLTIVGPSDDQAGAHFRTAEIDWIRNTAAGLDRAFVNAADRSDAEFLPMSPMSGDHGVGSDQPWVEGASMTPSRFGSSFHPNAAGMRAVADAILDRLV